MFRREHSYFKKTPSEWNKFSGIGGIVLFTAVFATLSAGYAMYTVFDDIWTAIGFGILWGLMIFNWTGISFLPSKNRNMVESDSDVYSI
jgi:fatty acid desaturase